MEIFNIHITELLLIAGLALVIFGPERLPEVGRFVGKQVARFLAWQQQSPELQMVNEMRGEFEKEIAALRDELVRTRNQLDVSQDMNALRAELKPMLNLQGEIKQVAEQAASSAKSAAEAASTAEAAASSAEEAANVVEAAVEAVEAASEQTIAPPALQPAPPNKLLGTEPTNMFGPPPGVAPANGANQPLDQLVLPTFTAEPAAPDSNEQAALVHQLHALSADLHALMGELHQRGVLGPDWQPPSRPTSEETISR